MQVFGEWAQVECVELVNDGSGLAFGIVGGRSSGVVIKSVLPGGVADRDGRLRSGDMLLRIGAVCVVGMCARQAAAVLRQCGSCVRLLVARPAPAHNAQSLGASPAPVVPSRLLADPVDLERRLAEAGHDGFGVLCEESAPPPPTIIEERHLMRPVASIVAVVPRGAICNPQPPAQIISNAPPSTPPLRLPLDMAIRGTGEPETLSYEVDVAKDSELGLGITVAGYVCEQEELSGIFVKSISAGSAADLCRKMQVNDRIVEVDGVSLHGVSNPKAVALLRGAKGPVVHLKALRYLRGAGFERLQRALAKDTTTAVAPPSPSVTSLAKYSFSVYEESTQVETDADDLQVHLPSPTSPDDAEIVIGVNDECDERAEARRIQDKWREILDEEQDWPGHDYGYDVIVGTIIKGKETGLGISLEGTVRVIAGREVQARHYIRAIAPNGPVDKAQLHKVGDELLEVNGWRVLGSHHVEVVSRLRAVASPVRLVCARSRRDETKRLTYARNMLGGSLQDLLSPPQRMIKAKSESSVVSLCSANTILSAQHDHDEFCQEDLERNKSRSLEPLSGLAMWSDQVEYIQLIKEDRGLGFSILDYLDPSEPASSVIVVRSVVRGGAAAREGRLAAGDRLMSVNGLDVSKSHLAVAVNAIKSAPRGVVTIGVSKPLPCSTVVGGGQKLNGHSLSSQECINSLASDDHTGMDSFHECLQEYGEGLEVVQICLEPEDPSIKDEEVSALGDLSMEECLKKKVDVIPVNGNDIGTTKSSNESLDEREDDLTITDDLTPRELQDTRNQSKENESSLKQQSKEISTSDEMVFAVTPTGLERISFEKYWSGENPNPERIKSDGSWKECLNSPEESVDASLLYIDYDIDGYETCLEDDYSTKHSDINGFDHTSKQTKNPDVKLDQFTHVKEHVIKQMKSLRIEPNSKKPRKKSPTRSKTVIKRQCIEYYNDQAECLEEYKKIKQQEDEMESKKKAMDLKLVEYDPNKASDLVIQKFKNDISTYNVVLESNTRRMSAPAIKAAQSETDEEESAPTTNSRRKSVDPLKFITKPSSPKMTVSLTPEQEAPRRWGSPRQVTLRRTPGAPLGVSIVGGKVDIISNQQEEGDDKTIFGIFIKNVVPHSPAGDSGELQTGDRILEVDGVCVRSAPHDRAVELIRAAGDDVTLTVQSLLAWNTDSSDVEQSSPTPPVQINQPAAGTPEHEIKITVTSEPDPEESPEKEQETKKYSDSESSDEEDERELGGRIYSEKGVEIDRASAGAIKRSKEEKQADKEDEDDFGYTTNKIRKKYANLGDTVVAVRLERGSLGLGLSLAGHRDRSRMAVFVCGLHPAGAASKANPTVKVGDEILEVNGIVLHGRCHLNASAIIKGLAGPSFKIILLRRKQALEDVAVKPLTQFPVALEEETEDQFASYRGVRKVTLQKAQGQSLGIMIIEGRHSEVGQGIFISDIQEHSSAEEAGLQIGDMILAVNRDSLVGCGYDAATSMLRRTEGVVLLTVCHPSKVGDDAQASGSAADGSGRQPSRNHTPDPLKGGVSRPQTPKPAPSPIKVEPPPDPASAPIVPNKDTVIEIDTQNQSLGLYLLGGSDTPIKGPAAVILQVYPSGKAAKDGRLKSGDLITEASGVPLTKDMTQERLCVTIKHKLPKIKMTIHRPDPINYEEITAELVRKPGKGLGLSFSARCPPPGVFISDIITGSAADVDGRLQKGDIIQSLDGQDLWNATLEDAAVAFKMVSGKALIKAKRFKIVR